MNSQIIQIEQAGWQVAGVNNAWIEALESGKVLYFPQLAFNLLEQEKRLLTPTIRHPKSRNISLDTARCLQGAAGDALEQELLIAMLDRFRNNAQALIHSLLPRYSEALRLAPTSYRPSQVETRAQSWRADDRRLHVDAFPSRPNRGERILRVFTNINPAGEARVWRVGPSFEAVARHFLPRAKRYVRWQARVLNALGVTKSLRSEYDHLMLQLHDAMKFDSSYQKNAPQLTMSFPPGSTWICFSDQTAHAAMSGQYMLEQTFHLPAERQYDTTQSPLAILRRLTGRELT